MNQNEIYSKIGKFIQKFNPVYKSKVSLILKLHFILFMIKYKYLKQMVSQKFTRPDQVMLPVRDLLIAQNKPQHKRFQEIKYCIINEVLC